ncbi:ABC transporter ATP-binding protein [Streptomyces zagrosensis]|uniref:ABC-2 type transport system ATP-binding protein n=1 Tax=Streptomyces zagrosensis TaxID=1042984 RepID=A0A7W9UXK4_9ACTN|nr:ABC transporter ATP-binding protein [Streptomyces zagrosensis]MBB5933809.1 ABC-2 type transport system ATP-binding protein [Streptomyces zagrosensis]
MEGDEGDGSGDSTGSVIDVTGLRRRYGAAGERGFEAVRGVSFSVRRGELFALLGTNGAGKTSTVELLEGLAQPSGGQVRVLGHDPYRERAAVRPRIGVMLQEGGFPAELTVAETIRMWAGCTSRARELDRSEGARRAAPSGTGAGAASRGGGSGFRGMGLGGHGLGGSRRKGDHLGNSRVAGRGLGGLGLTERGLTGAGVVGRGREMPALERVGLAERRDVRVKQLSGGERRRLDLALALLGEPEVLFLDEPTTGLDAEGRRETWELVRELRDAGTTVLLTTHYLEEAEELADRLAILHEGRIAAAGSVSDIVGQRPSQLSFRLPDGYFVGDLPPLSELGVTEHETAGRTVRLRTPDLQRAATGLLLWARDARVELAALDARSASLEEAFLHIARERSREQGWGSTVGPVGPGEHVGAGEYVGAGEPVSAGERGERGAR